MNAKLSQHSTESAPMGGQSIDFLSVVALAYLGVPYVLFLGGWFQWTVALPFVALLAWLIRSGIPWQNIQITCHRSPASLLLLIALAMTWSSLGGAGHFFSANPDWLVRDTVYADLVFTSWPPAYELDNGRIVLLRSAIGYFLPAAALSKVAGGMDVALYGWTALGTVIFFLLLPLPRVLGPRLVMATLAVIFFSGMDNLGVILTTGMPPVFPIRIEWWGPFSYSSLSGQLLWAPNHALPLWIATALLVRHWQAPEFPRFALALLPVLPLWTPFTVPGLAPFFTLLAYQMIREKRFTTALAGRLVLATLASAPVLWLLTLDIGGINGGSNVAAMGVASAAGSDDRRLAHLLAQYPLFVLMEFAILTLLVSRHLTHSRPLLWLAGITMAALPFAMFGPSNDLLLRVSTPALVVLLILTIDVLAASPPGFWKRGWPLGVVLLLGAQTPLHELWRAATFRRMPPNYAQTLLEVQKGYPVPHYFARLPSVGLGTFVAQPAIVTPRGSAFNVTLPSP